MKTGTKIFASLIASAMVMSAGTAEARQGVIKVRGQNGAATAAAGPNGGAIVRGRGKTQNADGSVTRASGGAYRTPTGGTGARASTSTVNPDGSVTRQGTYQASGQNGSVSSNGSVARDADGNWTGARNTSATNAATGNSYQGTTTIDPATGQPVHSSSCYAADGTVIACPR